jgi:putative SOS response-associated peptidase YedK
VCYTIQNKATTKELTERFNAQFELPKLYATSNEISGFTFPLLPILTNQNPSQFQFSSWGLIPHWAKDQDIRKHTLNAKLETLNEKPSFRDVQENRCILPVTGFYEWKWLDSKGKRKEKYLIGLENHKIFGLAGLHSSWVEPKTGEEMNTFTLLTTVANPIMEEIHNTKKRMPLMLDPQDSKAYLGDGEIHLSESLKNRVVESDGQLGLF